MTSVNSTIFEDDVSSDITELDLWSESLNVGRWRLLLKNIANKWGEDFNPNDFTELKIDDALMMKGYVDDVFLPLDERGVYTNMLEVVGRDYGRNLARLYHTGEYGDVKADEVIEDIFTQAQAEIPIEYRISYNAPEPAVAPIINILRSRTFLIDWLQEITKRIDWGTYIDINRVFQFFDIAEVPASGVTLKSVTDAEDNNILDLLKGESIGFSIANYVELVAGPLRGHWTNENAVDWTPGTGCSVEDDERKDYKYAGMASIHLYRTTYGIHSMYLNFPRYSHNSLDLSKPADMIFCVKHLPRNSEPPALPMRPRLKDSSGNIIEFRSRRQQGIGGVGHTEDQFHSIWNKVKVSIGEELEIRDSGLPESKGYWYFKSPATTFDWTNVVKIEFTTGGEMEPCDIWIDFLCIDIVEVVSRVESEASQTAYVKSMWWEQRNDIKSQVELDVIAPTELDKRKNPLKKIHITAIGQTDTKYAGQSVLVLAPNHGITEATKYRIIKLHHQVRKNPIKKGFSFITDYDLIKHEVTPTVQGVDPLRFDLADDPRGTLINILNLSRRREREAAASEMNALGDTHPMSTVFDELGVVSPGLPIYDPTERMDVREEEGYNDWQEPITFKFLAHDKTQYLLKKIAVMARFTNDADPEEEPPISEMEVKVEYSVNEGSSWSLFGTIIKIPQDGWAEYTREDTAYADFDEPFWVKFSFRIGQAGEGSVSGYVTDCELRERYTKTRWEPVE